MIKKGGKCDDLIPTPSIFKLAIIEPGTVAKEIMNLAGFDVVGEARNEQSVDGGILQGVFFVEVIGIVRLVSHDGGGN